MALGNSYEDNNEKKFYEPTVYSDYRMSNTEGVDPSALSFSFYRGMLKIAISPKKNTEKIAFDHENNICVYLTHTKARMLAEEIKTLIANPNTMNNVGVTTGDGLISFSDGKELGINGYCLIIRKIDEQTGVATSSYAYEFKSDYHYSIRNFNDKSKNGTIFDKYFYNDLEVYQFITILEEYYKSATGAIAYSVIDQSKYNNSRMDTKIGLIAEKLGVEFKSAGSRSVGNRNSFFNNNGVGNGMNKPTTFRQSTIDDLSDQLED